MAFIDVKEEGATPANPPTGFLRFFNQGTAWKYVDSLGVVRTFSTGITPEEVQDIVGAFFTDSASISVTYDDLGNIISADIEASKLALIDNAAQKNEANTFTESQTINKTGQTSLTIDSDTSSAGVNLRADTSLWGIYADNSPNELYFGTNNGPGIGEELILSESELDVKSKPIRNVTDPILAQDAATKAYVDSAVSGGGNVFGSEFQLAQSDGLSSTNSTSFQNKLTLTTPSLPAGTYRVGWTYSWAGGSTGADFEARLQQDNSVTLMNHSQEPKDAGTDQAHRHSGFEYVTLTAGSHFFDLDYSSENGGVTVWIQRARIELWRIS